MLSAQAGPMAAMLMHSSPTPCPPKAISPGSLIQGFSVKSNLVPPGAGAPGATIFVMWPLESAKKIAAPKPDDGYEPDDVRTIHVKTTLPAPFTVARIAVDW